MKNECPVCHWRPGEPEGHAEWCPGSTPVLACDECGEPLHKPVGRWYCSERCEKVARYGTAIGYDHEPREQR